ncbi:hypothetical protein Pcinc_015834 [Petrolisthes cinctipes]|uniref:Uncharacterized protein n=1 Tax=Petrolisthes cinctipes TaxID=88211 RepID=A0AAE1FTM7_PETCI|nr:hypothetical protein Pcinc_015834 [Petrolisthes cinctipes]
MTWNEALITGSNQVTTTITIFWHKQEQKMHQNNNYERVKKTNVSEDVKRMDDDSGWMSHLPPVTSPPQQHDPCKPHSLSLNATGR